VKLHEIPLKHNANLSKTFGDTYDDDFDPIVISGHDITITGAEGHVIEGNGAAYWDGEGSNGGQDKSVINSLHMSLHH
jgi:hypothetical protein